MIIYIPLFLIVVLIFQISQNFQKKFGCNQQDFIFRQMNMTYTTRSGVVLGFLQYFDDLSVNKQLWIIKGKINLLKLLYSEIQSTLPILYTKRDSLRLSLPL